MSAAVGEFFFVLQFLLEEWGEQNVVILAPETWKTPVSDVETPIYFVTDETVTVVVDCLDHYIQYHMPASELVGPLI